MGKSLTVIVSVGLLVAALSACSDEPPTAHQSQPTVIHLGSDAAAGAPDALVTRDAAGLPEVAASLPDAPEGTQDTASSSPVEADEGIIDPSKILFPSCQTGSPDDISDCIINLPTRAGTPITRPDPMAFELCRS
jgi:hypothetical protein